MCQHYQASNGRMRGKWFGVTYGNALQQIFRCLKKINPTNKTQRVTVLADHLRSIRATLDLSSFRETTLWALWLSHWQAVMRASNILLKTGDGRRSWNSKKDTHLGTLHWKKLKTGENPGIEWRLRWFLKPSKTDQSGERQPQKTFLLDEGFLYNAISLAKGIENMLILRNLGTNVDKENKPLFLGQNIGKEVEIETTRKIFVQ